MPETIFSAPFLCFVSIYIFTFCGFQNQVCLEIVCVTCTSIQYIILVILPHSVLILTTMSLLVRPALSADIPSIANIDIAANSAHPLAASLINTSFSGAVSAFTSLFQHFFSLPHYHFLIAEIDGQPVGFTAWKEGGVHEPDDFLPEMPEGADTKLIGYFIETVKAHKAGLGIEELAGMLVLFLVLFSYFLFLVILALIQFSFHSDSSVLVLTFIQSCKYCLFLQNIRGKAWDPRC